MIADVITEAAKRTFDIIYSYAVPEELRKSVKPGVRVTVPFGRGDRKCTALISNLREGLSSEHLNYKAILSVLDKEPLIDEEGFALMRWMKKEYICTYYDALKCIVPSYTASEGRKVKICYPAVDISVIEDDISALRVDRIQHIKALEVLVQHKKIPLQTLMSAAGVSISVINTLKRNGYIDIKEELKPEVLIEKKLQDEPEVPFVPTHEQKNALHTILRGVDSREYREYLIHGITGSGKTEIYLQIMGRVLNEGRTAIMLVPEISLTPMTVKRFTARFPNRVAVIHSRMTSSEKRKTWKGINNGNYDIVIGPRSAIFAPVKNPGVIVIDEEHESCYKSESVPKFHAADIAEYRCRENNAVLIKGSATPAVESYHKALSRDAELIELSQRTGRHGLPAVEIVDMRNELASGNKTMFSKSLITEMKKNLAKGEQTILFLNKRGYSSFVMCRTCGQVIDCSHCSISMTYHAVEKCLICHYCGRIKETPRICPHCSSKMIKPFGTGTQKLTEELQKLFPEASILRMDMDTTTGRGSHREILNEFENKKTDFLVGTQMVAKGHDFENVTLVGVMAADSILYIDDYRGAEKTFQQITQVSGRAGRGDLQGRVVVQTYNCDADSIICAQKHNYKAFYEKEIRIRKILDNPPFVNIGIIVVHGVSEDVTEYKAQEIHSDIEMYICNTFPDRKDEITVFGPVQSAAARLFGRTRWRLIIKSKNKEELRDILENVLDAFYNRRKQGGKNRGKGEVEISIDINPVSMM